MSGVSYWPPSNSAWERAKAAAVPKHGHTDRRSRRRICVRPSAGKYTSFNTPSSDCSNSPSLSVSLFALCFSSLSVSLHVVFSLSLFSLSLSLSLSVCVCVCVFLSLFLTRSVSRCLCLLFSHVIVIVTASYISIIYTIVVLVGLLVCTPAGFRTHNLLGVTRKVRNCHREYLFIEKSE